ncbi:MAG: PDZ domain-containing protein [Gemmataceae bacterium]|nr:PDZ domain-containing protein [Gemmataceae bacterium]
MIERQEFAAVRKLLNSRAGRDAEEAVKTIAGSPLDYEYLRQNPGLRKEVGSAALASIQSQRDRNLQLARRPSVAEWTRSSRVDTIVELTGFGLTDRDSRTVVQALLEIMTAVPESARAVERLHGYDSKSLVHSFAPGGLNAPSRFRGADFGPINNYVHNNDYQIVLADEIRFSKLLRTYSLISARKSILDSAPTTAEWFRTALFANEPVQNVRWGMIHNCLIVIDGSIELGVHDFSIVNSIVIVNGRLAASKDNRVSIGGSYIWAREGIDLPDKFYTNSSFASGGAIKGPKTDIYKDLYRTPLRPNLRAEPLGFKFFELADVGVSAKVHARGAEITSLGLLSPYRLYGLRVGDIVTKVDDTTIDSLDRLRRATRTAFVREAGTFHLIREGKPITRIVSFEGVRLP